MTRADIEAMKARAEAADGKPWAEYTHLVAHYIGDLPRLANFALALLDKIEAGENK